MAVQSGAVGGQDPASGARFCATGSGGGGRGERARGGQGGREFGAASWGQAAPPAGGIAAAGGGGYGENGLGAGFDQGVARGGFSVAHGADLSRMGRAVCGVSGAGVALSGDTGGGRGIFDGIGGEAAGESLDAEAGAQCAGVFDAGGVAPAVGENRVLAGCAAGSGVRSLPVGFRTLSKSVAASGSEGRFAYSGRGTRRGVASPAEQNCCRAGRARGATLHGPAKSEWGGGNRDRTIALRAAGKGGQVYPLT